MDKWLKRRWERAKQLAAGGKVLRNGSDSSFIVDSQNGPGDYDVVVNFRDGRLESCACTCLDFVRSWTQELNRYSRKDNIPRLHGIIVCKHVLAAQLILEEG